MRNNNRLYEQAQIRENEYLAGDMLRRNEQPRGRRLIAGLSRRLRRDQPNQG